VPVAAIAPPGVVIAGTPGAAGIADRPSRREFIEVGRTPIVTAVDPRSDDVSGASPSSTPAVAGPPAAHAIEPGWSLWGDLET
jgi:hypothetical protein